MKILWKGKDFWKEKNAQKAGITKKKVRNDKRGNERAADNWKMVKSNIEAEKKPRLRQIRVAKRHTSEMSINHCKEPILYTN